VSDGADRLPSRAFTDPRRLHFLPAPGRQDDFRIAPRGLERIHYPIAPETRLGQLRKDRGAAGNLDELLDPSDP